MFRRNSIGVRVFGALAALCLLAGLLPATAAAAAPTTSPSLVSPSDGENVGAANPVLQWTAVTGAAKYRVQVSKVAGNFTTTVYSADTVALKATPPSQLPFGTLYWRVAAGDTAGSFGPFSSVGTFTIEPSSAPSPITPTDGQVLEYPETPVVFSWVPLPGAISYTLQIDDADDFIGAKSYSTVNTSYTLTDAQTIDQNWFWHVQAKFASNDVTDFSVTRSYSISWPDVPVLHTPAVGSTVADVVFSWDPIPGAAKYQLQVSPNGDWANNKTIDLLVDGTRYSPPGIPKQMIDNGSYYWRVRAQDAGTTPNYGTWSDTSEVIARPPDFNRAWPTRPQLVYPAWTPAANPADNPPPPTTSIIEFQWTPATSSGPGWVDHASMYEIQVSTDVNFSLGSTVYDCYTNHTTFAPYADVIPAAGDPGCIAPFPFSFSQGPTYFWRVRGIDMPIGILGEWSSTNPDNTWRFVYSLNGSLGRTTQRTCDTPATYAIPVLCWNPVAGAEKYRVTIVNALGNKNVGGTPVDTYGLSFTPLKALTPSDGPFRWHVEPIDAASHVGIVPASNTWGTFNVGVPPSNDSITLLTPANGTDSVRMPSMTWTQVDGAAYYHVFYGQNPPTFFLTPLNGTTKLPYGGFTYAGTPLDPGVWYWMVAAYNTLGVEIAQSNWQSFRVGIDHWQIPWDDYTMPECNPHPNPNGTACTPTLNDTSRLRWDADAYASGYIVWVATDPAFTAIYRKYFTLQPTLTPAESWLDSQAGQSYYWFVQPCVIGSKQKGCGPDPQTDARANASSYRKASPAIAGLFASTASNPPSTATTIKNQVTFNWTDYLVTNKAISVPSTVKALRPTQEAKRYKIEVSTAQDFAAAKIVEIAYVDQTTYTPYLTTYPEGPLYWRVSAVDNSDNVLTAGYGPPVTKASDPISLLKPDQSARVTGVPAFTWNTQFWAARYNIEVYKGDDTQTAANRILSVTTTSAAWSPTTDMAAGLYTWHVRRVDAAGRYGPWSSDRSFTLQSAAATLTAPASGTTVRSKSPFFSWTPPQLTVNQAAVKYKLEVSTTSAFTGTLYDSVTTVMNAWSPLKAYADGTYYWRVSLLNASGGIMSVSAPWSFIVNTKPPAPVRWTRTNAYATSALISQNTFPSGVPIAFIANGTNWPDGLAGAAAAGHMGGPVLLVPPSTPVPTEIVTELTRLRPLKVVLLGGTGALPDSVFNAIKTLGASVNNWTMDRWYGADRYATAAAISTNAYKSQTPTYTFIASGANYPDALAGGAAGGHLGGPVLLVPAALPLPSSVTGALATLKPQKIVILGGTGVISPAIASALQPYQKGPGSVGRWYGADRYATAANIATNAFTVRPVNYLFVTTGYNFPSALAGGAAASYMNGPMLLVPTSLPLPSSVTSALTTLKPQHVVVLGPTSEVSDSVLNELAKYIVVP